jgi:hypothetical protein
VSPAISAIAVVVAAIPAIPSISVAVVPPAISAI